MVDVYIERASSYSRDIVEYAIESLIRKAGGINSFIPEDAVEILLKPNLLRAAKPERAVTTHPEVVYAVAKILKDEGYDVVIADSPGGPYTKSWLKHVYKTCGLLEIARELDIKLNYDTSVVYVDFPEGQLMKRFEIIKPSIDADAIITLPKLKNHVFTGFTGATKILFGCVPGLNKAGYHLKLKNLENFAKMLMDLISLLKPDLHIMDAVVGMEGDGPNSGKPKKVGLVMMSEDPYALDYAALKIIGRNPLDIPMIREAIKQSIIIPSDIQYPILSPEEVSVDFRPPARTRGLLDTIIPKQMRDYLTNQMAAYPYINQRCTGCGTCANHCPAEAIRIVDGRAVINYRKCIRCYCCHEFCPNQAIDLRKGMLSRILTF